MRDPPLRALARHERVLHLGPEPLAKLTGVGDRPPYLGERRVDDSHWSVDLVADEIAYTVIVEQSAAQEPRPESCGKAFGNPVELRVTSIEKAETAQ